MLLGQYEIAGDWRRIDEYLPAIRAVTTDDLVRVSRFYLRPENRTVAVLEPLPPTSRRPVVGYVPQGALH